MNSHKSLTVVVALACAATLASCGETVSTGGFKGASRSVAERVADFQKDATANDRNKLCNEDFARTLTKRLAAGGGCQATLEHQLSQVDALNLTVESIAISGTTAQARVKSTWSGKNRLSTLSLVKEAGGWRISGASTPGASTPGASTSGASPGASTPSASK